MTKLKNKKVKLKEHCSWTDGRETCQRRATTTHECRTCERLDTKHVMHACNRHYHAVVEVMKRHAVTKHPLNLLRVFAGMLKGEEW